MEAFLKKWAEAFFYAEYAGVSFLLRRGIIFCTEFFSGVWNRMPNP
jgi:hypothetical protein